MQCPQEGEHWGEPRLLLCSSLLKQETKTDQWHCRKLTDVTLIRADIIFERILTVFPQLHIFKFDRISNLHCFFWQCSSCLLKNVNYSKNKTGPKMINNQQSLKNRGHHENRHTVHSLHWATINITSQQFIRRRLVSISRLSVNISHWLINYSPIRHHQLVVNQTLFLNDLKHIVSEISIKKLSI